MAMRSSIARCSLPKEWNRGSQIVWKPAICPADPGFATNQSFSRAMIARAIVALPFKWFAADTAMSEISNSHYSPAGKGYVPG